MIEINKAHFPVTVLGPGRRIGIWLQGCSIRCRGCISQDTWTGGPGYAMSIAGLIDWCRIITDGQVDGVTISGGEPFDQPEALARLLDALRRWFNQIGGKCDLLCYSGYSLKILQDKHSGILGRLDAIIPEPYKESYPGPGLWRGSLNQPIVPLSKLGHKRYDSAIVDKHQVAKSFQMTVDNERIWYVGIPARKDMERMEQLCRERGIEFNSVSWR